MLRLGCIASFFVCLASRIVLAAPPDTWVSGSVRDTAAPAAILALKGPSPELDGIRLFEERLFAEAFKAKAWKLLERKRVDAVMAERAFQSAASDGPTASDVGTLLGVRSLLIPELERTNGVLYASLREIDVSSGTVLRLAEAQTDEPLPSSNRALARLLVGRLLEDASVPTSDSGTLEILSEPSSTVWIDGEEAGTTPLRIAAWPGLHRVAVVPGQTLPPPSDDEPDVHATTVIVVHETPPPHPHRRRPHIHHGSPTSQGSPDGNSDQTTQVVGGAIAAAAGVALVAAAVSMPDSVWNETWVDVRIKPGRASKVEFSREENSSRAAVGILGAVVLFLGAALLVLAASGD